MRLAISYSSFIIHLVMATLSWVHFFLVYVQRADNPSTPLTLPSRPNSGPKLDNKSIAYARVLKIFPLIFNSLSDFGWSMLMSTLVEDDQTPIRSGDEGVEYRPITISTMTFSLDRIQHIKAKLGLVRS
jgi:hypothetical protein